MFLSEFFFLFYTGDKMFSDKGNMLKHIACVHDGLKPYHCDYCGKAYGQSNDLKRHILKCHR